MSWATDQRNLTNRQVRGWAIGIFIAGVVLWAASYRFSGDARSAIHDVAVLLLLPSVATLAWELFVRRAYTDEVIAKVELRRFIRESGLESAGQFKSIDWDAAFQGAHSLDIYVMWAETWRKNNYSRLRGLLSQDGARLRVVLPDPDDPIVVKEIAEQLHKPEQKVSETIREAAEAFTKDLLAHGTSSATSSVSYSKLVPRFSCYRFNDSRVILALRTHRPEYPDDLPYFEAIRPGTLFEFAAQELDAVLAAATPAL